MIGLIGLFFLEMLIILEEKETLKSMSGFVPSKAKRLCRGMSFSSWTFFLVNKEDLLKIFLYNFTHLGLQTTCIQKAHDKIVSQMKKTLDNRPVAFGNFDIGGEGASHWVAVEALKV